MLRILGYTQLYTLVVLLLISCREDRQVALRAEEALHEVAERYHAEKSICDSLLDIATSYYLPNLAKGDTILSSLTSSPKQAECMLYEGIRHHDKAQELKPNMEAYSAVMVKAYRLFIEVEQNVELLQNHYLKGVVFNRLAIINVRNENYPQALDYFRKEADNVLQTGDSTEIAASYTHLAYSYYTLENGDSAIYYSNRALKLATHLDARTLASLYANTAYYQQKFGLKKERSESLLNLIPLENCSRNDSCRISVILADYYMEQDNYEKVDSLLRWTVTHSEGKPEILTMAYLRLSNLYEKLGLPDSALTFYKDFTTQQKLVQKSELGQEVAEARGQFQRLQQQRHHEHIVTAIVVVALIIILLLLLLWIRRVQLTRQLEYRIASINAKMDQYSFDITQLKSSLDQQMAESYDKEEKLRFQLNQSRSDYRLSQSKIERMLSHFFLLRDETSWPSEILSELLDIYRQTSSDRKKLLDELDNLSLSQRQKVICLLIRESKHDPKQLWFYAGCTNEAAFQSSKSQIKKKLQEAAPSSPVIQSLLNHFPQERTTVLKSKPKLKNEGK